MPNPIYTIVNSQVADNHCLFALLFFIHFIELPDLGTIDVDKPISQFDPDSLVLAVLILEMIMGVDTPDRYLEDTTKTVRQLAAEIRMLPKLSDKEFQKKLLLDKAGWNAAVDHN
jgi:hypothetical protein